MTDGRSMIDAEPVDLAELSPDGLRRLCDLLHQLCLASDHDATEANLLRAWRELHGDALARTWLLQRCLEVDGERHRQVTILKAAELDLAGGHITWVDYDELDPEMGWGAYCRCEWWRRCLPDRQAAEVACATHEQLGRGGPVAQ